jgi:hypothetical protein
LIAEIIRTVMAVALVVPFAITGSDPVLTLLLVQRCHGRHDLAAQRDWLAAVRG